MLAEVLTFVLGLGRTVLVVRRPSRAGAVALAVLAVAWLALDEWIEGPVLLTLAPQHGLTTADLLSLPAVLVAARAWARSGQRGADGVRGRRGIVSPSSRQPRWSRVQRSVRDSQGR